MRKLQDKQTNLFMQLIYPFTKSFELFVPEIISIRILFATIWMCIQY